MIIMTICTIRKTQCKIEKYIKPMTERFALDFHSGFLSTPTTRIRSETVQAVAIRDRHELAHASNSWIICQFVVCKKSVCVHPLWTNLKSWTGLTVCAPTSIQRWPQRALNAGKFFKEPPAPGTPPLQCGLERVGKLLWAKQKWTQKAPVD